MGNEEHGEPELALELHDLLQDLPLHDHVERGGRLVEQEQLWVEREGQGDDDALAHAARELVRIGVYATSVDAHELEQLASPGERLALRDARVRARHVDELVADPRDGVERGHRALEDEGDIAPAETAQLRRAQADELAALENDLPADDLPGRAQHLEDGVRDSAFSAAGLTGKPHDLPGPHRERDPVHGGHRASPGAVRDDQIADLEQRRAEPRGHVRARCSAAAITRPSAAGAHGQGGRAAPPSLAGAGRRARRSRN